MKKVAMTVAAATLAAVLAGCETASKSRYGDVNDDVYGSKTRMEYTQQVQLGEEVLGKMMVDPDFADFYSDAKERAAARGHKRPTVVVGLIENYADPETTNFEETSQMRKELMAALRKTRLFTVIDLQERERMKKTAQEEVDGGARGDNIQSIGEYDASDFTMSGEIVRKPIGGVWFHFLNLLMVDTSSGDEAWSDTVKIRKE